MRLRIETFEVESWDSKSCVRGHHVFKSIWNPTVGKSWLRSRNLKQWGSVRLLAVHNFADLTIQKLREVCGGLCRSVVGNILSNSCPFFWRVSVILASPRGDRVTGFESPDRKHFTALFESSISFLDKEETCTWSGKKNFFLEVFVQRQDAHCIASTLIESTVFILLLRKQIN